MLEFIQVATGKLPVKARFIIVVCTYCKRINKVSIIIDMILYLTSLHPHLNPQNILTFMLTFLAISVQLYSPEMNCVLIF